MDKSKEYIQQCDCPEIQSGWKPKEGDFFAFCGDPKIIKDYEIQALENRELSDIEEWDKIIKTMGGHFVDHFKEARECFVYLPRQDQIQGMMPFEENKDYPLCCYCFIDALFEFSRRDNCKIHVGSSMEQLWLAFYMYEKHSKIWSSKEKEWVIK